MKCVIEKQQVICSVLATDLHLMSPDGMFTAVNVLEPVSTDIISDEKETTISAIGHTVGYKAASGDDSNLGNEMKKALIGKTEFFSFLDQHYTSQKVENELAFYFHFPVSSTEQKKLRSGGEGWFSILAKLAR